MQNILILGAGRIGSLIAFLLAIKHYNIHLADVSFINRTDLEAISQKLPNIQLTILNAEDHSALFFLIKQHNIQTIVSCLPYFLNKNIAQMAYDLHLNYFDLTEDRSSANHVATLAKNATTAFVPQCGLAPGFISIVAHDLMQDFTTLDTVRLRVGALPRNVSNALHYSLTWSTEGLINEYGNDCQAIEEGNIVTLPPLANLEAIQLDGLAYEAFNTSGGIGSLIQTYQHKVRQLNYKTIRYPGHCEKMRFLMHDLRLNDDRDTLKHILEKALPQTYQDVVLVYVSVSGHKEHHYMEKNYFKKLYPQTIMGMDWSAIQMTTASSLCTALDLTLHKNYGGLIRQEDFSLNEFLNNDFGQYYAS